MKRRPALLQRPKPFAPRIIGTNDGGEPERVMRLRDAPRFEIRPGLRSDAGIAGRGAWPGWWHRLARRRQARAGWCRATAKLLSPPGPWLAGAHAPRE